MLGADPKEWFGAARDFTESVGLGEELPTPLFALARAYGLSVRRINGPRGGLAGTVLQYAPDTPERERWAIAHELGHLAITLAGGIDKRLEERAAHWIGSMILMPDRPFKRALSKHQHDWSPVVPLCEVSWEVFANRYPASFSSVVTIWDNGVVTSRIVSPWLANAPRAVPSWERALHAECLLSKHHVRETGVTAGYYVPGNDGWERVVTVASIDEIDERSNPGACLG